MKFYAICDDEGKGKRKKYAWAFPVYGYPTKKIVCERCNRQWNDFRPIYEERLGVPIALTNEYFADIAGCEAMTMVNEKVKLLIESNSIQSVTFSKMPVITQDKLSNEEKKKLRDEGYNVKNLSNINTQYYMLYPEIGANLHESSNFKWVDEGEYVCKHCGYGVGYELGDYLAPYYIKESSWNGTDIFRIEELMGSIFCTEKVKKLFVENDVSGVLFKEIEAR